jgi:glycosyltransferase involved in cell wall biosynthesis
MNSLSSRPLISIVTPCYNSAAYLELCIQSVQDQTYENVEHIIQDGASKDGTQEILERYNGKVDWISEKDKGQADGLDRALKRCRGDIILVLNADDELMPHACAWAVEQFGLHPEAGAIYGDQLNVGPDGETISEFLGPEPFNFEAMFCCEQVIPAQAAFMRRSALEEVGLGTDPTLRTCPDYEMWVRLGLKFPIRHKPGFLARYRWHPGSEGQQADMVPLMIASKWSVMQRTWRQPDCPPHLRLLKRRARAGVMLWGAFVLIDNNDPKRAIRYARRALKTNFNLRGFYWIALFSLQLPFWKRNAKIRESVVLVGGRVRRWLGL